MAIDTNVSGSKNDTVFQKSEGYGSYHRDTQM